MVRGVASLRYDAYIPGDPTVDWLPFFPSGGWIIDPQFGGRFINGGSPAMLMPSWVLLDVPWVGAWRAEPRVGGLLRTTRE